MQTFKGIQTLIAAVGSLPDCGFLYITGNSDTDTPAGLQSCTFLLPDTEEDELSIEDNSDYNSWLEAPTFSDIIENYSELTKTSTALARLAVLFVLSAARRLVLI